MVTFSPLFAKFFTIICQIVETDWSDSFSLNSLLNYMGLPASPTNSTWRRVPSSCFSRRISLPPLTAESETVVNRQRHLATDEEKVYVIYFTVKLVKLIMYNLFGTVRSSLSSLLWRTQSKLTNHYILNLKNRDRATDVTQTFKKSMECCVERFSHYDWSRSSEACISTEKCPLLYLMIVQSWKQLHVCYRQHFETLPILEVQKLCQNIFFYI